MSNNTNAVNSASKKANYQALDKITTSEKRLGMRHILPRI